LLEWTLLSSWAHVHEQWTVLVDIFEELLRRAQILPKRQRVFENRLYPAELSEALRQRSLL